MLKEFMQACPITGAREGGRVPSFADTPVDTIGAAEKSAKNSATTTLELPVWGRTIGTCAVKWSNLATGNTKGIRSCITCARDVRCVANVEDFDTAAHAGQCVSIPRGGDDTFPWRDLSEDIDGICGVAYPYPGEYVEEDEAQ